jgi:hypothetical protein
VVALVIAGLTVSASALPASGGAAGKSPFKPGLYVGKTSQGYPVKLPLAVGTEACDGNLCLFAPNDQAEIYIALECPAIGGPTHGYLDLAGDLVTKERLRERFSGRVREGERQAHGQPCRQPDRQGPGDQDARRKAPSATAAT